MVVVFKLFIVGKKSNFAMLTWQRIALMSIAKYSNRFFVIFKSVAYFCYQNMIIEILSNFL